MLNERFRIRVRRRLGLPVKAPAGWSAGPPDFVGVGTQRSGTTWWFRQIIRHPGIVAPWGKERHYFDPFWGEAFSAEDREAYGELFPRPAGALTGEWTPRYMYDPWALPLLGEAAPDARILVLLRDPWRRFLSGVAHEERVLARDLGRSNGDYLRLMIRHDALQRSLYAGQIERINTYFDPARVLILQYERCVNDPDAELSRTLSFLGLDPPESGLEVDRRAPAPPPASGLPSAVEEDVRAQLAADVRALVELEPEIDPELWPECR
ncbi:MAG: sulfotransferase [Solirubrobacterales bacterium]|nr:sulfotransferase [Solirubrobacterales bacterium]